MQKIKPKKSKLWRWLGLVVLIIIIIFSGWIWFNRGVVKISAVKVERGAIEAVVSASGLVKAPVYNIGPRAGGVIFRLWAKEGSRVSSGETLVEFEDTTRLIAPAGGVVAKRNYEEGETVVPGGTVLTLVNYDRSWVEAQIDEIDISGVKIGDRVRLSSDVYPDKNYQGEIYWIAPLAELRQVGGRIKMDEESYVFPCKIKFLGRHDELKVNMSVNVDIVTKRKNNALVVPREAIVIKEDQPTVFVIRKERAYQVPVEIGIRSFTSLEVLSGLSEGELIALSNGEKLQNQGRVKIAD